ncbi:phosphoribosylamine--glycine ligase [Salinimicrobium marinum]|uniref:Phosphoribosylamine--glycine ligase n=1 Tax=Salinimicrobium marinum TaxID=680283 RepID=A0A918SHH5_9FLAO|nr:phosphoribosylamine--glycine ligase [Salinimicrobium marinum]GHA39027.1 phosphoribosylamine--glycine ligase [Salinimicrobium marinum]
MNILILGSGGREHTFAYKIAESKNCSKLFVAPGNAGTSQVATNVAIQVTHFEAIKDFVLKEKIEMLIVGPEDPLVEGIQDFFEKDLQLNKVMVLGPSKRGALLEGSKERAKEFMALYNIPTAAYQSFTAESVDAGKQFLETLQPPYVLKADGLAAGKGVLILENIEEAKTELENMLTHSKFGKAGSIVVIEEFLDGVELSVFVLTDGENYITLPTAKDYKRIGEGDTGLNTGGMGAISPVPFADEVFMKKVEDRIIKPTVEGIKKEEITYKGFIFIGLIKVGDEPYVIEYNVRMGDPETEVVLPRIKSDLVEVFQKVAEGKLNEVSLEIDAQTAATVMLVSGGYPEAYEKGKEISGFENIEGSLVFHAGTSKENGKVKTDGGRVIAVTSFGDDYKKALKKSYQNVDKLHFDKMYFRKDLGFDLS